jgi:excisionase family DNA binding protein
MDRVPESEILFTAQELADYLRVKITTVHAWKHRKQGPPYTGDGRLLRYRKREVDNWLAEQAAKSREKDAS